MYVEQTAGQLVFSRACIPRGAVPGHASPGKVGENYFFFSFKAPVFFESLIKTAKPMSGFSSN